MAVSVTYQVRHAASGENDASKIKFMTDGILLNEMTSDFLHLVRLEFAVFEGSQQRDCLVTLSHGASIFAEILEDFAQAVAGVMQPAHHGPSWALHHFAYFIVRQAFNLA